MTLVALLLLACGGATEDLAEAPAPDPARPQLTVGTVAPADDAGTDDEDATITSAECDTVQSEPLEAGTCITGKLECGGTVVGHTQGGANQFDTRFYEQFFCTPATTDHDDGNERIYELELPENQHAEIWLDTPCADLDLAAMRFDDAGCPDKSSRVATCEMNRAKGKKREYVRVGSRSPSRWLVVVEGVGLEEGAFGLRVACGPGL